MQSKKINLDNKFMQKVLEMASSYVGTTSPDPAVAALIVKNNKIISFGYHNKFKSPHAETFAIKKAKDKAKGATLYVNLEPCSHWGNSPPCTDSIIKSGIKKVVAAMQDPNPLVNGKGFEQLKKAGIKVINGVLEKEAIKLNEAFVKHVKTNMPFVTLKIAMSLDGKIATKTKESKWISCKESQKFAHKLRTKHSAILVGKNTAILDDPHLTIRKIKAHSQPFRIVVDSKASIPINKRIISDNTSQTIIATTNLAPAKNRLLLERKGCKVLLTPQKDGKVDLKKLLQKLGKLNINSVLVEGGSQIASSFLEKNLVDKIVFIIAPIIIGGEKSVPAIGGKGIQKLANATKLKDINIKKIGKDIVVEAYIDKKGEKT